MIARTKTNKGPSRKTANVEDETTKTVPIRKPTLKELAADQGCPNHEAALDQKNDSIFFYHMICQIVRFSMYDSQSIQYWAFRGEKPTALSFPREFFERDGFDIKNANINALEGLFDSNTKESPGIFPEDVEPEAEEERHDEEEEEEV